MKKLIVGVVVVFFVVVLVFVGEMVIELICSFGESFMFVLDMMVGMVFVNGSMLEFYIWDEGIN